MKTNISLFQTGLIATNEIILCDSIYLRDIASNGIFPIGTFFRDSNLQNLNLSGQDLSGMNFRGADLRGSNLDSAIFDIGALNGSLVDQKYLYLMDEFDCYFDDFISGLFEYLYISVKFRQKSFEDIFSYLNMSYSKFAEISQISTSTLRKVRHGETVSRETAENICKSIAKLTSNMNGIMSKISLNPILSIYHNDMNNGNVILDRKSAVDLINALDTAFRIPGAFSESLKNYYKSNTSPNLIRWMLSYYGLGHLIPESLIRENSDNRKSDNYIVKEQLRLI